MNEMTNPLVNACHKISLAGYGLQSKLSQPFFDQELISLGRFLLGKNVSIADYPYPQGCKSLKWKTSVVIMLGAGIDSYCAIHYALINKFSPIILCWVNYGQPYAKQEQSVCLEIEEACWGPEGDTTELTNSFMADFERHEMTSEIEHHAHKLDLVPPESDLSWESYIVPARNLLLAAIGSQYGPRVWIVANRREDETVGARDKTSRFYLSSSKIFSRFYGYRVRVESPYRRMSKYKMVQAYLQQGGSIEALANTFSCYSPPHKFKRDHCGTCYACYKRDKLFKDLTYDFPFATKPEDGPHFNEFQEREIAKGR